MSREFVPAELHGLLENVRSEVAPGSFESIRGQIELGITDAAEKVAAGQDAAAIPFLTSEVTAEVASEVAAEVQSEATAATAAEVTAAASIAAR
jgi:hypothetical protein